MKRLISLAALTLAIVGCAPIPIEQTEPYRSLEVDMPAREVYDNLLRYPYCGAFTHTEGTWDGTGYGSFVVRSVINTTIAVNGGITGKGIGPNKTVLNVHRAGKIRKPLSDIEVYINRLLTGSCK